MAKRKAARKTRTVYKTAKRKSYKRSSSSQVKALQLDAMGYGAVRGKIASLIEPYTEKIPVIGGLSDELGMGAICYFAAKHNKGMIRNIALKGLVVENARVGDYAGGLIMGNLGQKTNTVTSNSGFYG